MIEFLEILVFLGPVLGALIVYFSPKRYIKTSPFYPLISFLITGLLIGRGKDILIPWLPTTSFGVAWSNLGVIFSLVISSVSATVLWYSLTFMKDEEHQRKFYGFMLLFTGAMLGLVLSPNLLQMFIFWELISVCSYFLISFYYQDKGARVSGAEAFLLTKIGDIALLGGILLLFSEAGTFSINVLINSQIPQGTLNIAASLFIVGGFAKAAQVPFQVWLADAMDAPTPVSALLHSATLVQAPIYLFGIMYPLLSGASVWGSVAVLAAVSGIITGVFALVAEDIKEILAYSTTSQISFMFIAVTLSSNGIVAGVFYLASHAMFKSLMFLCTGNIIHTIGSRNIKEVGSLGKEMPYTFIFFTLGVLSLAAIPPLNGFWSKEFMLEGLKSPVLKVIVDIGFVITIMYAMRLLYYLYLGPREEETEIAPAGLIVPELVLLIGMIALIPLVPAYSNYMGTNLPFKWVLDPFILIAIGFTGLYIYYEYLPRWEKEEIRVISNKLNTWYDTFSYHLAEGTATVLNAKENTWERVENKYIDSIVEEFNRLKGLGKVLDHLERLTPKRTSKSLLLVFVGTVLIVVITCFG